MAPLSSPPSGPPPPGPADDVERDSIQTESVRGRVGRRVAVERVEALEAALAAADADNRTLRHELERLQSRRVTRVGDVLAQARRRPARAPGLAREALRAARTEVLTEPPAPPPVAPLQRVRRAFNGGNYEGAIALLERLVEQDPDDLELRAWIADAHYKTGDLTATVRAITQIRMREDSFALRVAERGILARIYETSPHWVPRIPGPPRPVRPRSEATVLHLLKESYPYQVNGFTMRSRYTLVAQRAAGLDPVVVTSIGFPRKAGVGGAPAVEEVDGVRHHRLDPGPAYPLLLPFDQQLADQAFLTARVAYEERPALVHAGTGYRGFETALVGLALREHLRIPLVYEVRSFHESVWTTDRERAERGEHYARRYAAEVRCMQEADAVITIAEAMRGEILARGIPADKVHVVPNGVDPERFTPVEPDPALRARLGLGDRLVLGYVSNIDFPREGHDVLVEAVARLAARGRDAACLVVGDGVRRGELERHVEAAGVADRVVFTGRVPHDEVARYYALIDVFVVPRVDERAARLVTPLKPFEAMALGRPVVVSDLPALVELVQPGERGLAFPPGDPDGLADVVERLADDPALRARLADAGRRWVLAERTWAANGPRYRAVYDEVLARGVR